MKNERDWIAEYAPTNDAERTTLQGLWDRGELNQHWGRVLELCERHREDVWRMAGGGDDPAAIITACKCLVLEASVHHKADMEDQLKAIHDHLWYEGEKGRESSHREIIVHEWIQEHAPNWRRWRRIEYFFVIDKNAAEIVRRFTFADRFAPLR